MMYPLQRFGLFAALAVVAAASVVAQSPSSAPPASTPATGASSAAPAIPAKLEQGIDTTWAKAGDKLSAILQQDTAIGADTLPKGTKITGTVTRAVKQDKQHPLAGVVIDFDAAVLKNGTTLPIRAAITALYPSRADEIEQVEVGSGDITDAFLRADKLMGSMQDPNGNVTADSGTKVNGVRAVSHIKGVVLFAAPGANDSGAIVARAGQLELSKWTRMSLVLTSR